MYNNNDPYAEPIPSFEQPVPAPDIDPDSGWLLQVMYSIDWLQVLLGALTQLLQSTTWDEDNEDDLMLAQNRAMLLMNILAGSAVSTPGLTAAQTTVYKYDADSDTTQVSFDGGTTAQDAPGVDPRHQTTFPPNMGTNQPCDSASSVVAWIENLISTSTTIIGTGSDATSLAAFMLGLLVDLGPFGILIDLITAVALGLVSLGADVINLNMTADVYQQFLCILLANMDSSGRLTADALATVESQVTSEIGGIPADILNPILSLMGEGGINNAGSTQHMTGDCASCEEWCYQWDFTTSDGGWSADPTNGGTWVDGAGWEASVGSGGTNSCYITLTVPSLATVTAWTLVYSAVDNDGSDLIRFYDDSSLTYDYTDPTSGDTFTDRTISGGAFSAAVNFMRISGHWPSGSVTIKSFKIGGTGTNPFGANNC